MISLRQRWVKLTHIKWENDYSEVLNFVHTISKYSYEWIYEILYRYIVAAWINSTSSV